MIKLRLRKAFAWQQRYLCSNMKFRLECDVRRPAETIRLGQQLFLIGSCFTENIGEKLRRHKFTVMENPAGILFNPVSVAETLTACIENRKVTTADLFELNEGWHSWKHHSRFSDITAAGAVEKINTATEAAHRFLKTADHIMITLGSAWIYTLTAGAANAKAGAVAANNHKAPAAWFQRRLMSIEEVLQVLDNLIHRLLIFNPGLQIMFTISPVRHAREGLVENNRSKAVLISAVHHLVDKFDRLYYFPAYELVIDDLRDYRFYAEDLVHPNYFATQYVWEKFTAACIAEESRRTMEEIAAIRAAFTHKPFHAGSAQHRKFLNDFFRRTQDLLQRFPFLDFEEELRYFST